MLFNSLEFVVFLPIVFVLYWYVFRQKKWQNLFVVVASYVFYGWWDWRFLFLIAVTSGFSFVSGIAIERFSNNIKVKRYMCASNIVLNLTILGVFKYYDFFTTNLASLSRIVGWNFDFVTLDIILPVGISFYTFQALSYTIDVYKGKMSATHDPIEFFAFISFFPQLVAGPIERATNLLPQFQKNRSFDYSFAVSGCREMLWGFFKKIVIADNCARFANIAFNNYTEVGSLYLFLGAFFFSFQIYGDFSGYSSIAIGCAKLFGIKLQPNFRFPYFSRDVAEFWKRWHISLNKWFVDYVYIPLGGSRTTRIKVIRNIFVIFLLSGLWHGPNWTYVSWGLYHALLFSPLIYFNRNKKYSPSILAGRRNVSFSEVFQMGLTFVLISLGWIVFRSDDILQAYSYIVRMFQFNIGESCGMSISGSILQIVAIFVVLVIEWRNRDLEFEFMSKPICAFVRKVIYIVLLSTIYISYMISITGNNTFIYFQF